MTVTLVPPPAPQPPAVADPLDVLGVPGQVNLDYAATAPCARAAADAVAELLPWYASVHRGAGALSRRCTLAYERARQTVGDFLGARADDHVVFTRNTTDALNLLARRLLDEAAARAGRRDLPPTALRASVGLGSTTGHVDRLLAALAALA
ncbi:aminotransferase class V-fold PLP-dependent enzyme [Micromonospora sp. NPDC049060]|uniref:aminotransferase class V-fold PLP-dependent enzyme n=1 Tax=Micromonospora sp. NPDC049060 TaxID=3154828 RepID=UPI0033E2AEA6